MPSNRRAAIKQLVLEEREITLRQLERIFPDVSAMTLRRDLIKLEQEGILRRTHGGAVSVSDLNVVREDYYTRRAKHEPVRKQSIAHKALPLISGYRSIFLDSGTTLMAFAKIMPDDHLAIITSGPGIAMELIGINTNDVMLIGGRLARNTLSLSGPNSLRFLSEVNIDIAFLGTSGYTCESGFTSGNADEVLVKQAVLNKASTVVMMMDSTKVGNVLPFTFAHLEDIDYLVSDDDLPQEVRDQAKRCEVQVL